MTLCAPPIKLEQAVANALDVTAQLDFAPAQHERKERLASSSATDERTSYHYHKYMYSTSATPTQPPPPPPSRQKRHLSLTDPVDFVQSLTLELPNPADHLSPRGAERDIESLRNRWIKL